MQDGAMDISALMEHVRRSETSEIVVPVPVVVPVTQLVFPCPVDLKTGIVVASASDAPAHLGDEDAARREIERQASAA